MAQYWIQIPVENAKEVVQRKIDELVALGTLPDYAGYTVSYGEDCEVVFDGNKLTEILNANVDFNTIYFGTFIINASSNLGLDIYIFSSNTNGYNVFPAYVASNGQYPYIIWNGLSDDSWSSDKGYFFGYKFTLTPPAV